eukprot:3111072-Prymnesium_polylepis.2
MRAKPRSSLCTDSGTRASIECVLSLLSRRNRSKIARAWSHRLLRTRVESEWHTDTRAHTDTATQPHSHDTCPQDRTSTAYSDKPQSTKIKVQVKVQTRS